MTGTVQLAIGNLMSVEVKQNIAAFLEYLLAELSEIDSRKVLRDENDGSFTSQAYAKIEEMFINTMDRIEMRKLLIGLKFEKANQIIRPDRCICDERIT